MRARHLEGAQRLGEQRHDLDLGVRLGPADELHAKLGELARLSAKGALLAHDGRLVAQARGEVCPTQALGGEAGDGQREVGAQHEQAVVGVEQLERRALDAAGALEHGAILEQRGLHRHVAVGVEARADLVANGLAGARLPRQDVPEAPGRAYDHGVLLVSVLLPPL